MTPASGRKKLSGMLSAEAGSLQLSMKKSQARSMSSLKEEEELAKLTIPQLIERITDLTTKYAEDLGRVTHELLIRAMQQAK